MSLRRNGSANGNGNGSPGIEELARRVLRRPGAEALDRTAYDALEIAIEARLPYVGLRDVAVDETLLHYLPLSLALREQVAPVVLVDDTLTVATVRPSPDLEQVARRFPRLSIALVVAPADEIVALLESFADEAQVAGVGGER